MCPPTPDRNKGATRSQRSAKSSHSTIVSSAVDPSKESQYDTEWREGAGHSKNKSALQKGNSFPVVSLSPSSLFLLMCVCAMGSFVLGSMTASSHIFLTWKDGSGSEGLEWTGKVVSTTTPDNDVGDNDTKNSAHHHLPAIPTHRLAPRNMYTTQTYSIPGGIRSHSVLLASTNRDSLQPAATSCEVTAEDGACVSAPAANSKNTQSTFPVAKTDLNNSDSKSHGIHIPSGQHLLVDFEFVDPSFLRSETLIAAAMIDLIQQSSMTMLSYHCHSESSTTTANGVSCVGVLLESHVAVHTWPRTERLALDLFSCGSQPVIPLLGLIHRLFGKAPTTKLSNSSSRIGVVHGLADNNNDGRIMHLSTGAAWNDTAMARATELQLPRMVWSFKARGFRPTDYRQTVPDADINWLLGYMHVDKTHIASVTTNYQRIDIYDIVEPRLKIPDRVIFLDGIIQSRSLGEHAYHEALVHPALFCHENPRRVVIIGGGEGATLREVLKHNTVNEVIMVEIDKKMADASQKYLPEWSYCGDLVDSTDSCFDDPRATIYYTDAIAWFIERFGVNATVNDDEMFDVIIMDALDPNSVAFSDQLYNNNALVQAFSRALRDDGIFIAQVGELENVDELPESYHTNDHFVSFVHGLDNSGFESIMEYAEAHGRFVELWSFLLAMKDSDSRSSWFASQAEMELKIAKRLLPTKSGRSPVLYFDGASMAQYQFTARVVEDVWCIDKPDECSTGHGFDPDITASLSHTKFEVRPSEIVMGGRGVFAKELVPQGTVIGLEECVHGMFIPSATLALLDNVANRIDESVSEFYDTLRWGYVDGYGWLDSAYGLPAAGVDPGIMTFVNHGCNGTYNVGTPLHVNEMTIDVGQGPEGVYDDGNEIYHPFVERQFPQWECQSFVALRDIQAGEELLDNYLVFGGGDDPVSWDENLKELKKMCSGGTGPVTEYDFGQYNSFSPV